jgi:hypothetical protein
MQNEDFNQNGLDAQAPGDRGPGPRTTASCQHCGRPLTGRKERFCSDRCRMRVRRDDQSRRIAARLRSMEEAIEGLKDELKRVRP